MGSLFSKPEVVVSELQTKYAEYVRSDQKDIALGIELVAMIGKELRSCRSDEDDKKVIKLMDSFNEDFQGLLNELHAYADKYYGIFCGIRQILAEPAFREEHRRQAKAQELFMKPNWNSAGESLFKCLLRDSMAFAEKFREISDSVRTFADTCETMKMSRKWEKRMYWLSVGLTVLGIAFVGVGGCCIHWSLCATEKAIGAIIVGALSASNGAYGIVKMERAFASLEAIEQKMAQLTRDLSVALENLQDPVTLHNAAVQKANFLKFAHDDGFLPLCNVDEMIKTFDDLYSALKRVLKSHDRLDLEALKQAATRLAVDVSGLAVVTSVAYTATQCYSKPVGNNPVEYKPVSV